MMLGYIIATIAGVAATTQASVNTETRRIIKSPYLSAAFNFVVSFIEVALIALIMQRSLYIPIAEIAKYPPWIWVGGVCGPVVIIMSILCLPPLGSARNMMLACTGQILTGLIIDEFGLFGSQTVKMTAMRMLGAALVLGGIVLASFQKKAKAANNDDNNTEHRSGVWIFVILALVNGAAAAIQVAANGTLNTIVGNAAKTTMISMTVAFITINIVMLTISIVKGPDAIFDGDEKFHFVKPNMYMVIGGTCAVIVVGGNTIAANILSTGLVNIMNLAGMMASSLVVDAVGFLGIEKKPITLSKVIGVLMIIGGAALISLMQ